jgi:hypothetical protein
VDLGRTQKERGSLRSRERDCLECYYCSRPCTTDFVNLAIYSTGAELMIATRRCFPVYQRNPYQVHICSSRNRSVTLGEVFGSWSVVSYAGVKGHTECAPNGSVNAYAMAQAAARFTRQAELAEKTRNMPNPLETFDVKQFLSNTGIGRTRVKLSKGSCVYAQGADCDATYYLQKGSLRLTITSDHGKEAVIAIVGRGDFIGDGSASAVQRFRSHSAYTLTDCLLLRIAKDEMSRVVREEPEMSATFIAFLFARTGRVQADLVDQLFNSSEKRLARMLLLLANFEKRG